MWAAEEEDASLVPLDAERSERQGRTLRLSGSYITSVSSPWGWCAGGGRGGGGVVVFEETAGKDIQNSPAKGTAFNLP